MNSDISWSVTGHQPHLLGGFTTEVQAGLLLLARTWMVRTQPARVISGMAAGWDIAVAYAAVLEGVPLVAALAWSGQGSEWPDGAKAELHGLLEAASIVHVHAAERTHGMWTQRDAWVMAQSSAMVALWSGAEGGTGRAVAHAAKMGLVVENLWDEWTAMQSTPHP